MQQELLYQKKSLAELVPLYKDPSSNSLLPSTQFDMYASENAGLVKFDLLGLKTLTVIQKTISLLKEKNINLDIKKIKLDDSKIFETLSSGSYCRTISIGKCWNERCFS